MSRLFSGIRIRARLSGAFLMVALLGGAVGAFGVWGLAHINDMNTELYEVELRGLSEMKDANLQLVYAGRARNSYLAASTEREREAIRQQFDAAVRAMDILRERANTYYRILDPVITCTDCSGGYFDNQTRGVAWGFRALDLEGLKATGKGLDRTTLIYRDGNCLGI